MLDFLDPLELLSEDTFVPANFSFGATGLAKNMDPGSSERDVQSNTKLEIPLWLAQPLARRHMVNVKLPVVYGERYRRKLNAGAEMVSLRNKSPYFYEVGNKMNNHLKDIDLSIFLCRTFKQRYHELLSKGLNAMSGEEVLELCSKLSVEEQQLFEGGRLSIAETDRWLRDEAKQDTSKRSSFLRKKRAVETDSQPEGNKQGRA